MLMHASGEGGGLVYSISGGKLGIIILALGQSGDIGSLGVCVRARVCIETIFGLGLVWM